MRITFLDKMSDFGELILYAFFVLIAGIALWRISIMIQRSKSQPKAGKYFRNKFRDHIDKKR